jgi:protein-S-isoprenylcysteine O-methyltransferase Ste14
MMKLRNVLLALVAGLLFPFLPVIVSGKWDWWEGWAFAVITILLTVLSRVLAIRKNPDLAAERSQFTDAPGVKAWDRKLVPWIGYYLPAAAYILFGLDQRLAWSPQLPVAVEIAGLVVFLAGYAFSVWAMVENRFFSSVVRIQTERGHTVCDTGPYRLVRHPGYAGGALAWLALPLFLGALSGYFLSALTLAVYLIRTALEDNTLQEELPGYKEFAQKTKYRLIPGVW